MNILEPNKHIFTFSKYLVGTIWTNDLLKFCIFFQCIILFVADDYYESFRQKIVKI